MLSQGLPVIAARQSHAAVVKPANTSFTHGHAALVFSVGGRARIEQNGDWLLTPGDALLIPAGQPHRLREAHRSEFWGMGFSVPCFASDAEPALFEPFERVREGGAAVVQIPPARHAVLELLFRELETKPGPAVQRSLLTLVLNEVSRASATVSSGAATPGVVAASLRYIERNALRRLTLGEVAEAIGKSPAYVTSALSRATGRSAVEWIINARMAEARRRLVHSDELVDIIAERVGYTDPTHFIRMFRRAHGMTPAAWRAARRSL